MSQQTASSPRRSFRFLVLMLLLLPFLAGCAYLGNTGAEARDNRADEERHPEPYTPTGFDDLLIPSELAWSREKSMVVNTASYAGGVLYFNGRVDVNSLTDFFSTTMKRNGWKLVGSVKYQDVLLAFTKPYKTSTIIIKNKGLGWPTDVHIFITDDLAKGQKNDSGTPAKTTPFSF